MNPNPDSTRLRQAVSVQQAAEASPQLASLAARARESSERLAAVRARMDILRETSAQ